MHHGYCLLRKQHSYEVCINRYTDLFIIKLLNWPRFNHFYTLQISTKKTNKVGNEPTNFRLLGDFSLSSL